MLHSEIQYMLESLKKYECEVLIYTNGRLLNNLNISNLNRLFRFIVPIHGYRVLHDSITGVNGSFDETMCGLKKLYNSNCKTDIKIIINSNMIENKYSFFKTLSTFREIPFNNAVHITKMADTIISKKNKCESINNELAGIYTKKIYDFYSKKNCIIKIFDTCIKYLDLLEPIKKYENFEVYFKDKNYENYKIGEHGFECRKQQRSFSCSNLENALLILFSKPDSNGSTRYTTALPKPAKCKQPTTIS